jgi:hypothetical protein
VAGSRCLCFGSGSDLGYVPSQIGCMAAILQLYLRCVSIGFSLAFGVFQQYLSGKEISGRKEDIAIIGTTSSVGLRINQAETCLHIDV